MTDIQILSDSPHLPPWYFHSPYLAGRCSVRCQTLGTESPCHAAGLVLQNGDKVLPLGRMTGLKEPELHRVMGVLCYALSYGDKRDCARLYRTALETNQPPCRIFELCEKWFNNFLQHGDVHNMPNPGGAPSKVDPEHVESIIKDIKDNSYPTFSAALSAPQNAAAVEAAGCSERHVLRLINSMAPELEVVSVDYKVPLSEDTKMKRKKACQKLLKDGRMLLGKLMRTFFMDWGKIYVDLKKGTMVVDVKKHGRGTQTRTHVSKPTTKKQVITLKFIVVVNAHAGPLLLKCATGSTDYKTDYKVPYTIGLLYEYEYITKDLPALHSSTASLNHLLVWLTSLYCKRKRRI